MRVHRIRLADLAPGSRVVTGSEAAHLAQVLRVDPGARVRAFDGMGREAEGVVVAVETGRVVVELGPPAESDVESSLAVTVSVSLLKGDKLADVVRQCTELGAVRFRPLLAERRDVPELSMNKLERLRRVAQEAAKQSGRAVVPEVVAPVTLPALSWSGPALVAQPNARSTVAELALPAEGPVTVLTGPEGGFTAEEVEGLVFRGALAVRLGARVLRAETAPVALLAALVVPEAH